MIMIVVRHGTTVLNEEHCWQGQIDIPLSESGVLQTENLGRKLRNIKIDAVYSSPLKRARQTTDIILRYNKYSEPEVIIDDRLMEIACGDWEGKSYSTDNSGLADECYKDFLLHPFSFPRMPNGESIQDVCNRTGQFFNELLLKRNYKDQTVLVSTHGCAMRGILHQVYDDKYDFWHGGIPANCAISIVKVTTDKITLLLDDKFETNCYYFDDKEDYNEFGSENSEL